jgi:serine/threonine protein kinase
MPLSAGDRIGPYEIIAPLGEGGMGEVYRARDVKLEREVAIKVLPEHLSNDPNRRQRFEHEAKVLATLNHPMENCSLTRRIGAANHSWTSG